MTKDWPDRGPVTLRTNLGDHAISRPLKDGTVRSELVTLDFCGPDVPNQGFKPMVRQGAFDAGELAIGTYLQALHHGKPLTLLPITIMARLQHHFLEYCSARGEMRPEDLAGKRIGVRIYAQTTAIWLRGLLEAEYGVDLGSLSWVCTDEPHLAEYRDPDNAQRSDRKSHDLLAMLQGGDVDAVILNGKASENPGISPLIPDPMAAGQDWLRRSGYLPINHVFVVDRSLAEQRPDVITEICRMFSEAKSLLPKADGPDPFPMGREALEPALRAFARHALRQHIVPRLFEPKELYAGAARLPGG